MEDVKPYTSEEVKPCLLPDSDPLPRRGLGPYERICDPVRMRATVAALEARTAALRKCVEAPRRRPGGPQVSAKTKIETWALVHSNGHVWGTFFLKKDAERLCSSSAKERVVRLVPYDAKKEAVVRAAKVCAKRFGYGQKRRLLDAVAALSPQQPKKRRSK